MEENQSFSDPLPEPVSAFPLVTFVAQLGAVVLEVVARTAVAEEPSAGWASEAVGKHRIVEVLAVAEGYSQVLDVLSVPQLKQGLSSQLDS